MMSLRVCAVPGCPALSRSSLCPVHSRASSRNHCGLSPSARGLGWAYQRLRSAVLREEPVCWVPGCGRPAATVDHVVPRSAGGGNDRGNLRGACPAHNYGRRT